MRGWMLMVSVVVACNGSAKRQAGEGEPHGGTATGSDTGVGNMDAGGLRVVSTHERVPSEVVGWTAGGIVSAERKTLMRWKGVVPGTPTALDEAFGAPATIVELGGGALGVGAAQVGPDDKIQPDAAALAAALRTALGVLESDDYRIKTAAWTADGSHLWVGVDSRSRLPDRKPRAGGPRPARGVVLDARLALVREVPPDSMPWQGVLSAGEHVVTIGGPTEQWLAVGAAAPLSRVSGGPGGAGLSGAGTSLAFTDVDGVTVFAPDGKALVHWALAGAGPVALSRDGALAAVGVGDHVQLWKLEGDHAVQLGDVKLPESAMSLAFSPDGTGVVAGCMVRTVAVLAVAR